MDSPSANNGAVNPNVDENTTEEKVTVNNNTASEASNDQPTANNIEADDSKGVADSSSKENGNNDNDLKPISSVNSNISEDKDQCEPETESEPAPAVSDDSEDSEDDDASVKSNSNITSKNHNDCNIEEQKKQAQKIIQQEEQIRKLQQQQEELMAQMKANDVKHKQTQEQQQQLIDGLKSDLNKSKEKVGALLEEQKLKGESSSKIIEQLSQELQQSQSKCQQFESSQSTLKEKYQQLRSQFDDQKKKLESTTAESSKVAAHQSRLQQELQDAKTMREEHQRKELIASNRLNAAKKQELAKANLVEELEDKLELVSTELESTNKELEVTKRSLESVSAEFKMSKEKWKEKMTKLQSSLNDEFQLNDERKTKMKLFIDKKAEELKACQEENEALQKEVSQTSKNLMDLTQRWKTVHAQWVQSQTRNRELQRDMNRIKKDSENLNKKGDSLEMKLRSSANESEVHKNKRLAAKHELMTVLRTLETERELTTKLRDSIKFTFVPKAISQQQLLKEALSDFEQQLKNLATKLGIPTLHVEPSQNEQSQDNFWQVMEENNQNQEKEALDNSENDNADGEQKNEEQDKTTKVMIDTTNRLLSKLENETQRVSQCIMTLSAGIERMADLATKRNAANIGNQSCLTMVTRLLTATANNSALHQHRITAEETQAMNINSAS